MLRVCLRRRCPEKAFSRLNYSSKSPRSPDEVPIFEYVGKRRQRGQRLYVAGYSFAGALGIPTFVRPVTRQKPRRYQPTPYRLAFEAEISDIACGYAFTLISSRQKKDPKVWGCGINTDSQLGVHTKEKTDRNLDYVISPTPLHLPITQSETVVEKVACGRAHSLVLTSSEVFSLGNNAYGQCGRRVIPDEDYSANPTVYSIKGIDSEVMDIVCGHDHSLFLTQSGEVYSCGWGADGQTGLGHYQVTSLPTKLKGDIEGERITQMSSFADCCLAVSDKGDLFGWGNSEYNQLSVATPEPQLNVPRHLPFKNIGKVVQASAGGTTCCILNDEGDVFVWGFGILGKGPKLEDSKVPELIPPILFGRNQHNPDVKVTKVNLGAEHFAAITNLGELYTWGKNTHGCLALGLDPNRNQYFPLKVPLPGEVTDVSCGVDHTFIRALAFI